MKKIMATVVFIVFLVVAGTHRPELRDKAAFFIHPKASQEVAFFIHPKASQEVAFFIHPKASQEVAFFIHPKAPRGQCENRVNDVGGSQPDRWITNWPFRV